MFVCQLSVVVVVLVVVLLLTAAVVSGLHDFERQTNTSVLSNVAQIILRNCIPQAVRQFVSVCLC